MQTLRSHVFGSKLTGFIALYSLVLNLLVAAGLTPLLRIVRVPAGTDCTVAGDFA